MEIEVKIEPHSYTLRHYCLYWRKKKRFNLFNIWNRLECVYDGVHLVNDQPVLFENFDEACNVGEKFKNNPNLITEHYQRENEKYNNSLAARNKRAKERNKTVIF